MEKLLRTRLASVGILLVVFASGAVLGVAWERTNDASPPAEASGAESRRGDDDRDRRRDGDRRERRRIVDGVGLRPAQEDRVDSIIETHKDRMKELQREFREEYNPRYWSLIQDTRDAIRTVLDDDQQARYDSLLAEHDRKRRERRDDHDRRDGRDDDDEDRDGGARRPDGGPAGEGGVEGHGPRSGR